MLTIKNFSIFISIILSCSYYSQNIPKLFGDYQYIFNENVNGIAELGVEQLIFSPKNNPGSALNIRGSFSLFKINQELNNKIDFGISLDKLIVLNTSFSLVYYFGVKYMYSWNQLNNNLNSVGAFIGTKVIWTKSYYPFVQYDFEINKQYNLSLLKIGFFINFIK